MPGKPARPAGLGSPVNRSAADRVLLLVVVASVPLAYPSINVAPGESAVAFGLGIALTVGLLLTGIATVRADVFPRWAGFPPAATIGFFFDFFIAEFLPPVAGQVGSAIFGILLALALAWMGYALCIGRLAPAA